MRESIIIVSELHQKMMKLHFCDEDGITELHSENIGWTEEDILVCIDFGDLSSYIMN